MLFRMRATRSSGADICRPGAGCGVGEFDLSDELLSPAVEPVQLLSPVARPEW